VPLTRVFKGLTGVLPTPPRIGDAPRIKSQNPISLREVSRASAASGEKITLPEAPVGVLGICRVAATNLAGRPPRGSPYQGLATQRVIGSAAGFRNFGLIPFRPRRGQAQQPARTANTHKHRLKRPRPGANTSQHSAGRLRVLCNPSGRKWKHVPALSTFISRSGSPAKTLVPDTGTVT
jgi:hypothetical protein